MMRIGGLLILLVLGFVVDLFALHKTDHRYVVSGYVRDGQGVPQSDLLVTIEHKEGKHKEKVKTNASGYYEKIFHLHNANVGEELIVTAGSEVKRHKITFDPKDVTSSRKGQIDFGAPAAEGSPVWLFGLIAGGMLTVLCFLLMKKKRAAKMEKKKGKKGK
jgi:hypothetical protein